ncbi:MAG: hypothetical protein QOK67_07960, partial [Nitrososphaeraceae archaeon]|nr:hypothetical protein [Nitrososphaeraceae archaeon]
IQEDVEIKQRFIQNITRDICGRYVVRLPWRDGHPPLPSNREVAIKRLKNTTRKLRERGMLKAYDNLFTDWEIEDFIEDG